MPAWALILIEQLPTLIAAIAEIIKAANTAGSMTQDQKAQIAAYSSAINGINQILVFHANS